MKYSRIVKAAIVVIVAGLLALLLFSGGPNAQDHTGCQTERDK